MLTALVVDPSATARRRVGGLLRLGGWHVVEAADAGQALLVAASRDLDLVVTEVDLPGETGLSLLARLRASGSRARLLVVTRNPTARIRAAAAGAGAMACLAKPIDPRSLIDFLVHRAAATAAPRHLRVVPDVEDVDTCTTDRLQEMFIGALPHRFRQIADRARAGDAMAVASAAQLLAGAGGQLGHLAIATVCQEIAADARRGVVSPARLRQLEVLSVRAMSRYRPVAQSVRTGV